MQGATKVWLSGITHSVRLSLDIRYAFDCKGERVSDHWNSN